VTSRGTAPVTLPRSPSLPAGQGKAGSGEGVRDGTGPSSIVGTAATALVGPTTVPGDGTSSGCPRVPTPPSLRSVQGPDAGHAVLEAVSPEAGDVVVHDLHLPPGVARVLKEVDLVVGAVLGSSTGQGCPAPRAPGPQDPPSLTVPIAARPRGHGPPNAATTHDLEGADGHQAVAAAAVGPGVPAWVVPLLQHKLLPSEALPLEAQPPAGPGGRGRHGHPARGSAAPPTPGLVRPPHPGLTGQTPPGWSPLSPGLAR